MEPTKCIKMFLGLFLAAEDILIWAADFRGLLSSIEFDLYLKGSYYVIQNVARVFMTKLHYCLPSDNLLTCARLYSLISSIAKRTQACVTTLSL